MGSGISSKCKNKNDNINLSYEFGIVLGRGGFATVFGAQALHQRQDFPKEVAVKAIMIKPNNKADQMNVVQNEIDIMRSLKHPSIIAFYESFMEPNAAYIVMEFVKGFNLLQHLVQSIRLNEDEAATIIKQVAEALHFLHGSHVMHRDIKLENILVSEDCNGHPLVKLTDFGLASKYETDETLREICGTSIYAAPEMLLRLYNHEIDLWSLGVVLYMLLCGYPPFYEDSKKKQKLFQSILVGKYVFHKRKWEMVSDPAKSLVAQLLVVNPQERLSASDVLENEWIQEMANCIHQPESSCNHGANDSKLSPPLSELDVPKEVESWYCSYYENGFETSKSSSKRSTVGASKVQNLCENSIVEIIQAVQESEHSCLEIPVN